MQQMPGSRTGLGVVAACTKGIQSLDCCPVQQGCAVPAPPRFSLATFTASACSFTPVLIIMALQAPPCLCRAFKNLAWEYGTSKKCAGQLERGRLHQQSSSVIWLLSCQHWIGVEPVFRSQSSVKSRTFSPGLCPAQSSATTDTSIKPRVKFQKLCHFGGEERFVFVIVWTTLFSALAAPGPTVFTFQQ